MCLSPDSFRSLRGSEYRDVMPGLDRCSMSRAGRTRIVWTALCQRSAPDVNIAFLAVVPDSHGLCAQSGRQLISAVASALRTPFGAPDRGADRIRLAVPLLRGFWSEQSGLSTTLVTRAKICCRRATSPQNSLQPFWHNGRSRGCCPTRLFRSTAGCCRLA